MDVRERFVMKAGDLIPVDETIQKFNPNHDSQGRFASGGAGGAGKVNEYDAERLLKLQDERDKNWAEQKKIEKKYRGLAPHAVGVEYSEEDKKKWLELEKQNVALIEEQNSIETEFFDNAISMKSGNSAADGNYGYSSDRIDMIRDEYVVPDELTLKTNAGLRRNGRVTTKVQRFDELVSEGEIKNPTRVYRAAILKNEQIQTMQPNTSFIDRGFQSTGFDRYDAISYGDIRRNNIEGEKVLFDYTLQRGLNAVNVGYGEIVVQRGAKVSITGLSKYKDYVVVEAEVSKP